MLREGANFGTVTELALGLRQDRADGPTAVSCPPSPASLPAPVNGHCGCWAPEAGPAARACCAAPGLAQPLPCRCVFTREPAMWWIGRRSGGDGPCLAVAYFDTAAGPAPGLPSLSSIRRPL